MSQQRRQMALLAVLVAVLGFLVLRPGERAGRQGAAGAAAGPLADWRPAERVADVRLEALAAKPGEYRPGRDPFRFQAPPAPPKPPPPPPRPAPAAPPRQQAPAQQQAKAAPPKPTPPAIDFRYLGSFGPDERRIAVFIDAKDIYNARRGDVVKERFVVRQIGFESADIGFVGFPDEPAQRLPLGG